MEIYRAGSIKGNFKIRQDQQESDIAADPGTYVLFLKLPCAQAIQVGRLGNVGFAAGIYAYVGSAFGPGGLAARIAHHRRVSPAPRWHIDYLRAAASVERIWYTFDPLRREHQWAGIFADMKTTGSWVPGFGASDCSCSSHLYLIKRPPLLRTFRKRVHAAMPGHGRIFSCELRFMRMHLSACRPGRPKKIM